MIVDAHQHLWAISRPDHEWPTADDGEIFRDVDETEYRAAAPAVDRTVLVQAQPRQSDTDWLLSLADASQLIGGVVGWADLSAPEASAHILRLARSPKLKGLRPMLQGLAYDAWILRDDVQPGLKAMVEAGLVFDALIHPRHLPVVERLATLWPDLTIVIDHCAKPAIGSGDDQAWRDAMARAADHANLHCKLSGLVTEISADVWDTEAIDAAWAYADHVFDRFGSNRILWGSDWPVITSRCSLQAWLGWTHTWLSAKPQAASDAILGGTACRVYDLN